MSTPVALKGHHHVCPMVTGNTPHVGGPVSEGAADFTVNGVPVALKGHKCQCQVGGPDTISQGHNALTINGIPVALQGSSTAHGGVVVQGDSTLTID